LTWEYQLTCKQRFLTINEFPYFTLTLKSLYLIYVFVPYLQDFISSTFD
jgi:hypothetical protein